MAMLQTALCAVLIVTLVTAKPIYISEGGDSAKSSESSESNSSEETAVNADPSQDPLQPKTGLPNPVEETLPLGTTALLPNPDLEPSPSTQSILNGSNTEYPQTSADALQLMPVDPSQIPVGVEIPQHMPNHHPNNNADIMQVLPDTLGPVLTEADKSIGTCGTNAPQISSTYQEFPKGAAPPFPPHIINPTAPFSTAAPMPIPFSTALTGVPVCFTFQLSTPEPDPARGDS